MLDVAGFFFAFTVGVFTILSPCSYAMLPGYVSYYLGENSSIKEVVLGSLACTLGLISVYLVFGTISGLFGSMLGPYIPLLNLLSGFILIALGMATLWNVNIPYIQFSVQPSEHRGHLGMFLFGLLYGLAGVGCSSAVFLSVFIYSISLGWLNSLLTFIFYALGMGVPLLLTSLLVSQAKDMVVNRIQSSTGWIHRFNGAILILAGFYMLYLYGSTYM
jgi:cytochrome c-type biogenesis protein